MSILESVDCRFEVRALHRESIPSRGGYLTKFNTGRKSCSQFHVVLNKQTDTAVRSVYSKYYN